MLLASRSGIDMTPEMPPTDSLVERFGLFTIVVLGEVVFGASTACPRRTGAA
jgi:low temperature requirement protein LtrA